MTAETRAQVEKMFGLEGLPAKEAYEKLKVIVLAGIPDDDFRVAEVEHRYEVAEDWIGTYGEEAGIPWAELEKVIYG